MSFKENLSFTAGLCSLAFLLIVSACTDGTGTGGSNVTGGRNNSVAADSAVMVNTSAPGIDFSKTTVGLPADTLDFITTRPVALAGAGQGHKVFFGIKDEEVVRLYSRDLDSLERTYLTELTDFNAGSLATDAAGRFIVFSRNRDIERYVEDPFYKFPPTLSLVYRMDTTTGEIEELFSFRDNPWRAYRSDNLAPFISPDGSAVYALTINLDWLTLDAQLKDWLAIEADYRDTYDDLTADERSQIETRLRQLLTARHVAPLMEELGVTSSESGQITVDERNAVASLERETGQPEYALLIWKDGETRLLPLKLDQAKRFVNHYILAASRDTILVVTPEQYADQTAPQPIFGIDLESGEVSPQMTYTGAPSNYQLDSTAENLILVYNPIDADAQEVMTETHVQVIPLDGGESQDITLPGDYIGLAGITSDYSTVAGQDRDDYDLYVIDTASGERRLIKKLLAAVDSIFIDDTGRNVVYSDSGVLFHIRVPADPPADPAWVTDDHFTAYKENIMAHFALIGFDPPDDLIFEWEDRQGLGEHELAVEIRNPAEPDRLALLRYQIDQEQVVSIWFPRGYLFPISDELTGSDLDYYAAEEMVEEILDRLGWLSADTRTVYQPGPNPLYDGRTDSFIVVFRDGYWLGDGDDAQWVYNDEVTMRVRASDGLIAEMTISDLDEVRDQPLTLPLEKAEFLIRNRDDMPIPETANVRFDIDNYRLLVHQRRLEHWGADGYEMALVDRLCYEIDTYILPEDALILTTRIDVTTGDILGELDFLPSNIEY